MKIVFDEIKRQANLRKHGFDFAELNEAFFHEAETYPAKLGRLMAIGWQGNKIMTVIFRPLGTEGLSIVSMRPASRKERGLL